MSLHEPKEDQRWTFNKDGILSYLYETLIGTEPNNPKPKEDPLQVTDSLAPFEVAATDPSTTPIVLNETERRLVVYTPLPRSPSCSLHKSTDRTQVESTDAALLSACKHILGTPENPKEQNTFVQKATDSPLWETLGGPSGKVLQDYIRQYPFLLFWVIVGGGLLFLLIVFRFAGIFAEETKKWPCLVRPS